MNSIDIFLLTPIAIGFVFGIFKGLIKELASLLAIVLGIFGSKLLAPAFSKFLINSLEFSASTAMPFAYLVLFVGIVIALLLLANLLDKFFKSIALGGLNKLGGGLFGGLKWALIVSVLLTVFEAVDSRFFILNQEKKAHSLTYKPLLNFGPTLWDKTKKKSTAAENE